MAACLLGVLILQGCDGGSLPPEPDESQALPILTAALDAWKRGETPDAVAAGSPPVRVIDHEWQVGWTLLGYEVQGEPLKTGLSVRQSVALQLKTPKGKPAKKTVNYLINTGPQPVITREDLDGE
jgi:hypothetical protein